MLARMSKINVFTDCTEEQRQHMHRMREAGEFFWLDLRKPSAETIADVGAYFGWHPLLIEDLEHRVTVRSPRELRRRFWFGRECCLHKIRRLTNSRNGIIGRKIIGGLDLQIASCCSLVEPLRFRLGFKGSCQLVSGLGFLLLFQNGKDVRLHFLERFRVRRLLIDQLNDVISVLTFH